MEGSEVKLTIPLDGDKEYLRIGLSKSCVERLRRHISSKYPSYRRGWLSLEVENFINQGIVNYKKEKSEEKHTHTSTPKTDDILNLKTHLITYFGLTDDGLNKRFNKRELLNGIKAVLNVTDDRTAKARLDVLLERNLIYETMPNQYKIVSLLDDPVAKPQYKPTAPTIPQNEKIESEITCAIAKASEQRQRISPLVVDIK